MAPRFFIVQPQINQTQAEITGKDQHHLINVLRKKIGDEIEIIDSQSNLYCAKIIKIEPGQVTCQLLEKKSRKTELPLQVTILQCLPKAKKMEWIIEKCTELGVHQIVPVASERTIPQIDKDDQPKKIARWNEIAKSAAKQCGRAILPKVLPIQKFADAVKNNFSLKLIPWENETSANLKNILHSTWPHRINPPTQSPDLPTTPPRSLAIYIGPEGGFSHHEIELAKENQILPIGLGPRILRTETAGIFVLSVLSYEFEQK